MPILSYFAVVGPALAVLLWLMSSSLQPGTPVKAPSAATTQITKPAPASPVNAGHAGLPANSIASAISQGALQPEGEVRKSAPAETTKSADATKSSVQTAQKRKKRKQLAQRRQRRDIYAPAYSYGNRYYADYQPFVGYRRW
jgi:hypothetical protein